MVEKLCIRCDPFGLTPIDWTAAACDSLPGDLIVLCVMFTFGFEPPHWLVTVRDQKEDFGLRKL